MSIQTVTNIMEIMALLLVVSSIWFVFIALPKTDKQIKSIIKENRIYMKKIHEKLNHIDSELDICFDKAGLRRNTSLVVEGIRLRKEFESSMAKWDLS